jgi:predicted transcriptional regulator
LETKLKYSNNFGKIEIEEKLRNISVNWNNIQKYSEHIIPPRLEWLSSLELINIKRNSSETGYSVTEKGREFYRQIPILENQVNDLNTFWYNNHAITTFSNIIWDTDLVAWNKFHDSNKDNYFKIVLYKAVDIYGKDGAMRMSLNITFLFIILELIKNYKIIIEFVEIEKMLSPIFITEKFIFSLHKAARETESYISIKIA